MDRQTLSAYRQRYEKELLEDCLPFWIENGTDRENGGIFTSLTRDGKVYAKDKSVWLNARCVWTYSYMCGMFGTRPEWRAMADNCLAFLDKHAIDAADKRMYFTLTADGRPLRKRRYFFSETFYIIGLAEYARAFNEPERLKTARWYYDFILGIYDDPASDPYKITPKVIPETRSMKAFASPMILLNVSHIMKRCDPENAARYEREAARLTKDIFAYYYKPELRAVLESVGPNGEFMPDATGGRVSNPGHTIEAAWFLASQAEQTGDGEILKKAENMFRWAVDVGWDEKHGGLDAFVDVLGYPPEQLEHNMKLWWPVCETLITSVMLYRLTGDEYYFDWFRKTDEYAHRFFKDPDYGEWYGYLTYDNVPAMAAEKGNLFKGPFHVPRMLAMVATQLKLLEEKAR